MGAKAATIWFTDVAEPKGLLAIANRPDEAASRAIAERVLGGPVSGQPVPLTTAAAPEPGHVYVGAFGGLTVVTHDALLVDRPSELAEQWWQLVPAERAFLLIADPDRAVGGFGIRVGGAARRSFSAHPIDILEDEGLPEVFERPFWAGEHPLTYAAGVARDPRALPFHPMEFAEQANREFLGFRFTHPLGEDDLDPARIQVFDFVPAAGPPPSPGAPGPGAAGPGAAGVGSPRPGAPTAPGSGPAAPGAPFGPPPGTADPAATVKKGRIRSWFGF